MLPFFWGLRKLVGGCAAKTNLIKSKNEIFRRPDPRNIEIGNNHQVEHGQLQEGLQPPQDGRHGEQEEDKETSFPWTQCGVGNHLGWEERPLLAVPLHVHHVPSLKDWNNLEQIPLQCQLYPATASVPEIQPTRGQEVSFQPISGQKISFHPTLREPRWES